LLRVANEPPFADLPPARVVPALANEGVYLASESSFHRALRAQGQNRHRGRAKAPHGSRPPTTHVATAPRQLWSWDMMYLPAEVLGRWFHYLILDAFRSQDRRLRGSRHHDSLHAAHLAKRAALAEGLHAMKVKPLLHAENGTTFKATAVLAMLHWLGINPSYSRSRVSDDNPFDENLFRTAKYRPQFPAQRHAGQDRAILQARHALYQQARELGPRCWSGTTQDRSRIDVVTLNAERATTIAGTWVGVNKPPLAA
jgi:transposase InsO family protein